jgi:zinc transport system substrate-binding protein
VRGALAVLLVFAAGLACGEAAEEPERPRVLVSILPLAWFVDQLAGGAARAVTLIPPGADPHSYEPTVDQMRAAERAVLWVRLGHPSFAIERNALEGLRAGRPDLPLVDAAAPSSGAGGGDPHVWLSPRLARGIAERIAAGLAAALPGEAASIAARRVVLDAQIEALDRQIAERLRPFRGRALFAYHPDWNEFASDYGLRSVTIESMHKEPDARALRARIEEARREHVKAIFVQPQFSKASAELVAREVGARVITIDALAYDWPATLRRMTDALVESFSE